MANTPRLRVNGKELPYWATVTIDRSIDAPADTFAVTYNVHDQTPGGDANPLSFDGDEPCEITLDGEVMLTGWIDRVNIDGAANGRVVQFSGGSKAMDLVACVIEPKPLRWTDKSIEYIVRALCEPYSIDVTVHPEAVAEAATTLEIFKADFGEGVHEAIARACVYKGLLAFSSSDGALQLARAGSNRVRTVLRVGENVLRWRASRDATGRFSDYYVISPNAGRFDPDNTGKDGKVARVQDPGVGRYRPTIIRAEQDVRTQAARGEQALWERNRRAGDSLRLSFEVVGWRHSDGIWAQNDVVQVEVPDIGLVRDMLVASASFSRTKDGSTVQLELVHPASVTPREVPLPRRSKRRAKAQEEDDEQLFAPETQFFEDTGFYDDLDDASAYGEEGLEIDDAEIDPWPST